MQNKMVARLLPPLFFLFTAQAQVLEVVGIVHGVVYLTPTQQGTYLQVHWWRNDTMKIVSWERGKEVQYLNNGYKERLKLFPNNTLKISNLKTSDTSVYQVYLEDDTGQEHIEKIFLMVYSPVPKPTVNANVTMDAMGTCRVTLECSVEQEGVTYEWILPSKFQQKNVSTPKWSFSFNPMEETYICKVSNSISSNNASLTYRPPCSWTGDSPTTSSCTTISVPVALGHLLLLFFLTLY